MARRTREEAAQTRAAVLETALALFGRKGYAGTRLDEIADEIGLSRGAIYGHFKTKPELFEQVMKLGQDPVYGLLNAALADTGPPLAAIRRFMVDWFCMMVEHDQARQATEILLNKAELTEELEQTLQKERQLTADMIAGLASIYERARSAGDVDRDLDPAQAGLHIFAYVMGVTQTWMFNEQLFDLRGSAEGLADRFLRSLEPD